MRPQSEGNDGPDAAPVGPCVSPAPGDGLVGGDLVQDVFARVVGPGGESGVVGEGEDARLPVLIRQVYGHLRPAVGDRGPDEQRRHRFHRRDRVWGLPVLPLSELLHNRGPGFPRRPRR